MPIYTEKYIGSLSRRAQPQTRRNDYDDAQGNARNILLVAHSPIRRYENIEFILRAAK
jgi:hypothetical protein